MKPLCIGILGAGPAGLYAALLLKRQNPDHQVTVIERNPAGATFGFGVVLSDRTLGNFRAADPASFDAITAHQATWEAIQTFKGPGVPVVCGGHTYSGIARQNLLSLLQHRCEELGVHLQFETEVDDLAIFGDCDLIIAADGVNSMVRRNRADAFGTTIERGRSKYIWLGAKWVPTAFTFIFQQTEHGLFQAHAYPYDKETSTCIVMCRDETWQRAGLDQLTEAESVRFCQELLRPYLGEAQFLANRSLWSTFQTVKNQRWSHGRIVLLGDAAHTAHWSIGSGTKLAMEDAITLVGALGRQATVPEALAAYERERRPIVERLQAAARVSELACENVEESMHLDPLPFAFQLLTRSGRLDYAELRKRDPAFIDQVDRWYAAQAGIAVTAPALTPIIAGGTLLANRLVLAIPETGWLPALQAFQAAYAVSPGLLLLDGAIATPARAAAIREESGRPVGITAGDAGLLIMAPEGPAEVRLSLQAAADLNEANTLVAGARAELVLLSAP